MLLNTKELVLKDKNATIVAAILVNGISIYSKKTKEQFLDEGYLAMSYHDGFELISHNEDIAYLKEWSEITESQWWYALEMLPPLKHAHIDGHEFFFCSEAYTGNIHSCYCAVGNKYYTAMRRTTTSYEVMVDEIGAI